MMRRHFPTDLCNSGRALCFVLAAMWSVSSDAVAQGAKPGVALTPVTLAVMSVPRILPGSDGRAHVVYELKIENATPLDVDIVGVDVLSAKDRRLVGRLDRKAVAGRLARGASRGHMGDRLGPAQFGVLFVHLSFPDAAKVPARVTHKLRVAFKPRPDGVDVTGAETRISRAPPAVLGAPLRGTNYVAADSCCDTIRHVRALLSVNGAFHLSQRYAIDWEQMDAKARLFVGNPKDVRSYHIYGKEVLAVADGVVVARLDGLPDQVPGALPKGLSIEEADGNHIVLDIGNGMYVLYAHLKPGSVRVTARSRVRKGQVIGQVGNSGNTSEPHLHLHVMDGPSPLASNGIPYVFERFAIVGRNPAGTDDFDRAAAKGTSMSFVPQAPPSRHIRQLPLDLTVVAWPETTE